jgi:hypothetical protein
MWVQEKMDVPLALRGIWGSGRDDVYAVSAQSRIYHSTGNGQWTAQIAVDDNGATRFSGIWGSGKGDIYAIANQGIFHSTGDGTWIAQAVPTAQELKSIWGSSATDVYAVGAGTILHSTGDGTWVTQPSVITGDLQKVWGSASNDVYVVGSRSEPSTTYLILHSRGDGTWTREETTGCPSARPGFATAGLRGLWGIGGDDVYAVGFVSVNHDGSPSILHSAGAGTWSMQPDCPPAASEVYRTDAVDLIGVWGSPEGDVYAVGSGGTILHRRRP